jgi:hypothetical protein
MKKPGILNLRPSQFVLGMKEVETKIARMRKMSEKELAKFCDERVIPVVLGPRNEHFMIDHHHFARACWELNIDAYSIEVIKDLSDKSEKDFWNFMVKKGWTYLHDQFGLGPHSPMALPVDIRCLADDPFRSLVWSVIDAGGIRKDRLPFFEFQWAAFFRLNLDFSLHSKSDFRRVTKAAVKLARSKDARHLPGHLPR